MQLWASYPTTSLLDLWDEGPELNCLEWVCGREVPGTCLWVWAGAKDAYCTLVLRLWKLRLVDLGWAVI